MLQQRDGRQLMEIRVCGLCARTRRAETGKWISQKVIARCFGSQDRRRANRGGPGIERSTQGSPAKKHTSRPRVPPLSTLRTHFQSAAPPWDFTPVVVPWLGAWSDFALPVQPFSGGEIRTRGPWMISITIYLWTICYFIYEFAVRKAGTTLGLVSKGR